MLTGVQATVSLVQPFASCEHQIRKQRFLYEEHYRTIIQKKKDDKSYRYFGNVNRLAEEFPYAQSRNGKKVDVWCTNDYVSQSVKDSFVYI